MPSYTTSMPTSRAFTAICSAPLLWPSRPGLPTRILSGRPSFAVRAATFPRTFSVASLAFSETLTVTPVGARYSPKISRSAPVHSPVVTPAWAARMDGGITLPPAATTSFRCARAALASASSRRALKTSRRSICSRSAASSTLRIEELPAAVSGDSSVSLKSFTPTTVSSPDSMAWTRAVWDSTRRCFMYAFSTAATAPPMSSTLLQLCYEACSFDQPLCAFFDHDREPSKMSGYSSRSVSIGEDLLRCGVTSC